MVQNIADQVLIFKRDKAIFAFNFNPTQSFVDYGFEADAGKYSLALCSDDDTYGGFSRVDKTICYQTIPINDKPFLKLYMPSRVCAVYIQQ